MADYAKTFGNGFSRRRSTNPEDQPWRKGGKKAPVLRFDITEELKALALETHHVTSTETFDMYGSKSGSRKDNVTIQSLTVGGQLSPHLQSPTTLLGDKPGAESSRIELPSVEE